MKTTMLILFLLFCLNLNALYADEIISKNVLTMSENDTCPMGIKLISKEEGIEEDILINNNKNDSGYIKYLERLKKHVDIPKNSIQSKYYHYCTPNLSHLDRDLTYPLFPIEELCSIENCFRGFFAPEINEMIFRRLIELARVNFKNKVYLYLISGTESVEFAEKQNENIKDDHRLIYISVDDFLDIPAINKGVEIYNSETKKLMGKRSSK